MIHRICGLLTLIAWTLFCLHAIIWVPSWLIDPENPPLVYSPILLLMIVVPIWAVGMVPLALVYFFTRPLRTAE